MSHKGKNLGSERPSFRDREGGNPAGGYPVLQELHVCTNFTHTEEKDS